MSITEYNAVVAQRVDVASGLMIEGMLKLLSEQGFSEQSKGRPGQVHLEKYW